MKPENLRTKLFNTLDVVLSVSQKKFEMETKSDADRQAWGRLIVNAANSCGKLLDVEEPEERISKLEEKLKEGVIIPCQKA